MSVTTESQQQPQTSDKPSIARQYVNFAFFRIDRAFRAQPKELRERAKDELAALLDRYEPQMQILAYSTVGLKANVDFMLWEIGYQLEPMQQMTSEMMRSLAGPFLESPVNYLAMTKHSQYVREHVHEGQEGRRLKIVPGEGRYLFVYPFVKTRAWYLLPMAERQRMMTQHIAIGHKYPSVKLNTTYSFGLDDQEFVVAFETDQPADFLDLVQELRESEGSAFTLRDTPIYTCSRMPFREVLEQIG